jgi:hypothetical protein
MDANEAKVLFQRLYTDIAETTDTGCIRDMLLALDYLPLAIAGVAAYMQANNRSPADRVSGSVQFYQDVPGSSPDGEV